MHMYMYMYMCSFTFIPNVTAVTPFYFDNKQTLQKTSAGFNTNFRGASTISNQEPPRQRPKFVRAPSNPSLFLIKIRGK